MYTAPIGTPDERATGKLWPGEWVDKNPYLSYSGDGWHTGADLNLNAPRWDSDAHSAVYAIAEGYVSYARMYSSRVWGNIIVIEHPPVDGKLLFSRYGHVEDMQVHFGDRVQAGDIIASVGNGAGRYPYHLHFDISLTTVLRGAAWYWPVRRADVLRHFTDPKKWLQAHI